MLDIEKLPYEEKVNILKNAEISQNEKVKIIIGVADENERLNLAKDIITNNMFIRKVIASLQTDDGKMLGLEMFENYFNGSILEIVKTFQSDEKKVEAIKEFAPNETEVALIVKTIKDDGLKLSAMEKFVGRPSYRVAILKSLQDISDVDKMVEYTRKYIMTDKAKMEMIISLNGEDADIKKMQAMEELIKDEKYKYHIVQSIQDENVKIMAMERNIQDKFLIIQGLESDIAKVELMKKYVKEEDRIAQILATVHDKEILAKAMFDDVKISARRLLDIDKDNIEFVKQNIEKFIQIECPDSNVDNIMQFLSRMYEKNNEVYNKVDFRILDSMYIDLFGEDKINQISCYRHIQEQILNLSKQQLDIFSKCIDSYISIAQTEEWTEVANSILKNLNNDEYTEFINNIYEEENIDYEKVTKILQHSNKFNIQTREDYENYEQIKIEITDSLIQSDDIEDKKEAVLEKAFGHDREYLEYILEKFGHDIEHLPDSDIKYYVKILEQIDSIENPKVLEDIYSESEQIDFVDKSFVERKLKTEYFKLYQDTLFKTEGAKEIEDNVYDAGVDFSMIITAIGAFEESNSNSNGNYMQDWNRPKISTQHISTSYIRNDMLGTAPVRSICYGFNKMADDSLMASGSVDIFSNKDGFNIEATQEQFYTPNNQIDMTDSYNEMDFRRVQNGKRKEPDYIVVFRENGEIQNYDMAKKAQKDWGGLPIVVIDKQACLESEFEKVEKLISEYTKEEDTNRKHDIAVYINQKVRNNRQTDYSFGREFNVEELLEENYTYDRKNIVRESDLASIDKEVTATDRVNMQKEFIRIMEIKNKMGANKETEVERDEQ